MAYFSNGSDGMAFNGECQQCKFGQEPCPIAAVQLLFNYDSVNNNLATNILKMLVHDDGECTMLRRFWSDLHIEEEAV